MLNDMEIATNAAMTLTELTQKHKNISLKDVLWYVDKIKDYALHANVDSHYVDPTAAAEKMTDLVKLTYDLEGILQDDRKYVCDTHLKEVKAIVKIINKKQDYLLKHYHW